MIIFPSFFLSFFVRIKAEIKTDIKGLCDLNCTNQEAGYKTLPFSVLTLHICLYKKKHKECWKVFLDGFILDCFPEYLIAAYYRKAKFNFSFRRRTRRTTRKTVNQSSICFQDHTSLERQVREMTVQINREMTLFIPTDRRHDCLQTNRYEI